MLSENGGGGRKLCSQYDLSHEKICIKKDLEETYQNVNSGYVGEAEKRVLALELGKNRML